MYKRWIALWMLSLFLLSLTACGSKPQEQHSDQGQQEQVQTGQQDANSQVQANHRYQGTVIAVDPSQIRLATEDGEITLALTDSTAYFSEFGMGGRRPEGDMPPQAPGEPFGGQGQQTGTPPPMPEGGNGGPPVDGGNPPQGGDGWQQGQGMPPQEGGTAPQEGNPPAEGTENSGFTPGNVGSMGEPNGQGGSAMPGGPMGERPEPPAISLSDIAVGDSVTVETDGEGKAASVTLFMDGKEPPQGMGKPDGMADGVESYNAVTELSASVTEEGQTYSSEGTDENALLVLQGAEVSLQNAMILRKSDLSTGGDISSFYGVGAAALVTDGVLTLSHSRVETDAAGGTGIFAYGKGVAYVMDTEIYTERNTSGGIHVAGGGTLYAWDLTVESQGGSSAAIRSDRGSGTMVIDGGSYTSNGEGSPAIYSTADISVHNAKLTANGSEAVCIEGMNSIRLFDCDLSGNMKDLSQNDCTWNVILYQSMSGDSTLGNSTFEMVGGKLTAKNGGMFYTTNTESTFLLSQVDISYAEDSEFFLKCTGNANQRTWGRAGSNGADCAFTARKQEMAGAVIWDSISELDFYLLEGSCLRGAVVQDDTAAGQGGQGYSALYIDESSSWIVTGDSRLTKLFSAGSILDGEGNSVTVMGVDGTIYVQGNSSYTVTVDSYDSIPDLSKACPLDSWTDFAVAKP